MDAFLVKFNSNGQRQWATYYGGTSYDDGYSCAIDGSSNVYLAGSSSSSTAIATAGSHQSIFQGISDAFLVKFNSNGVRQWATYYGGSTGDNGNSCYVDGSQDVLLAGSTGSNSMIATPGSHQFSIGGSSDGFLVKFNGSGVRNWATYYGGPAAEFS